MERITRKTKKEIEQSESEFHEITIGGEYCFYWFVECEKCRVGYFKGDTILATSGNSWKCPNVIKRWFRKDKICMNSLYGGDKEYFHKYYKIIPTT